MINILIISFLLIVHSILLVNTLFTLWPEMTVYPYLLNNKYLLYKEIINPYPPALTILLAQIGKVFGYLPFPYEVLTWATILITDTLIFKIAKEITKKSLLAFLCTLFFVFLSVPFGVNGLWFDLIQTPLVLMSFYYFFDYLNTGGFKKLLLSFLYITVAFFIKQQAAWLAFWFLIYLFLTLKNKHDLNLKNIFLLATPFLILSTLHLIYFSITGLFDEFYFWVIDFPIFQSLNSAGYVQIPTLKQMAVVVSLFTLSFPVLKSKDLRLRTIPITALFLLLFAYPRFDYFHLIPSIAVLSLSFSVSLRLFLKEQLLTKFFYLAAVVFLLTFSARVYQLNWGHNVRFFEPEIFTAAKYLSENIHADNLVYIQNGPDQLLPLAKRLPPKPWVDELPWYLEIGNVQQRVLNGIEKENPAFIVYKPYSRGERYALGVYRPQKIADYLDNNYYNSVQISQDLWLKTKN